MIEQLKEELELITSQLSKGYEEYGLEWWVHNDNANQLRGAKLALIEVIKYMENKK